MSVVFPDIGARGLGVGLDLSWGPDGGFVRDPRGDDHVAERVRRFFSAAPPHGRPWSHAFFALQPRDRSVPRLATYCRAWDDAIGCLPPGVTRALHTTGLDLGAARPKARGPLLDLVNALAERHDLRWVNEDLGLWSLGERPLPYPLPPYLTAEGLSAAIRNTRECQRALGVPLLIEFPGFAKGVSLPVGDLDAYDFFRMLVEETEAPCTLDVGHLLSWRWLRGHRGQALFDGLDRLPLAHCFEVHLSGCEIAGDAFFDRHHGVLLDEQLELLDLLLERCPNLRAITYEDPLVAPDGTLRPACAPSLAALSDRVDAWRAEAPASLECPGATASRAAPARGAARPTRPDADAGERLGRLDAAFESLVWDEAVRDAFLQTGALPDAGGQEACWLSAIDGDELASLSSLCATSLLSRAHPGTGGVLRSFPEALASWRATHAEDADLSQLARRFCSREGRRIREGMGVAPGTTAEEAFADFAEREGLAEPLAIRVALARAIGRALVTSDEPSFLLPSMFQPCPQGVFAVIPTNPPYLVAALGTRLVEGPITELLATLLAGASVEHAARELGVTGQVARAARAELVRMGLMPGAAAPA